jgi:hypothetical protein
MQPMSALEIVEPIEADPEKAPRNGKTKRPEVIGVTRPDSPHPIPAVKCPEFVTATLKWPEANLLASRRRSGWVYFPVRAITLLMQSTSHQVALLSAVYAVINGLAYMEWLACLFHGNAFENGAMGVRMVVRLAEEGRDLPKA